MRHTKSVLISWGRDEDLSGIRGTLRRGGYDFVRDIHIQALTVEEGEGEVLRAVADARGCSAEQVVLALPTQPFSRRFYDGLRISPLSIRLVPEACASQLIAKPATPVGPLALVEVQAGPLSGEERAAKQAFDVITAAAGLLVLSPLLALTALLVRLDSAGPVLFRQTRLGFNGVPFSIYKFRTMRVGEDGPTVRQASRTDSRVTRVGYWLRRTSMTNCRRSSTC